MILQSKYANFTICELPKDLKRKALELLIEKCDFNFLEVNRFETMKNFYNSRLCDVAHLGIEFI